MTESPHFTRVSAGVVIDEDAFDAFKAEHAALHAYLIGLVHDHEHRAPTMAEYQRLVGTHDDVCEFYGD